MNARFLLYVGLAMLPWTQSAMAGGAVLFVNGFEPRVPLDVSETVARIRTDTGVPAMGAILVDRDGTIGVGIDGVRILGEPELVELDEYWHLGSDTKAMTAALYATYVRDGELSFDRTLPSLFPGISAEPAWNSVTIRHLLQHRGGVIPNLSQLPGTDPATVMANRAAWAEIVLTAIPHSPIGDFSYSNVSYVLVGAALEAHTGQPWEALMAERLFSPLGMVRCGFGAPPHPGNAQGHSTDGTPQLGADNRPMLGPAGTVHCDLESWGRFLAANLAGHRGESELLDATLWNELHLLNDGYAMGWGAAGWLNRSSLAHDGSNGTWYARAIVVPGTDRAYGMATNIANSDGLARMTMGLTEADSVPLISGEPFTSTGCTSGNDEQTYAFEMSSDEILNVEVSFSPFGGQLVLERYDDMGLLLGQTFSSSDSITLSAPQSAGRYVLRIYVNQFAAPCPIYQIVASQSSP